MLKSFLQETWESETPPRVIWRMTHGACVDCGRFGDVTQKHWLCLWCLAKAQFVPRPAPNKMLQQYLESERMGAEWGKPIPFDDGDPPVIRRLGPIIWGTARDVWHFEREKARILARHGWYRRG